MGLDWRARGRRVAWRIVGLLVWKGRRVGTDAVSKTLHHSVDLLHSKSSMFFLVLLMITFTIVLIEDTSTDFGHRWPCSISTMAASKNATPPSFVVSAETKKSIKAKHEAPICSQTGIA